MADPGAKVELLVLDVDGVLTDGSIIYDDEGRELKRFFVGDGLGIKAWLSAGFGCGVLSSRSSPAVERRMRELGVTEVVQGARDKSGEIGELCGRLGRSLEATAFNLKQNSQVLPDARPQVFAGDLVFYRANRQTEGQDRSAVSAGDWQQLVRGQLQVVDIEAEHQTMLTAQAVAQMLAGLS